ncbi:hypothetical protein NLG97_g468 [Lecanicillium saksenae]|uniref:Uncharacterized protein n=1 Tax=Lecanicillium saksenae TaxID=468837 RepID=A0ACC1R936_9HYPO|nr:hypothetical protein NLG97_g468 [Lecanicillium saksenae]
MAPSTVDLLFLTFNCAKALINSAVFANHLEVAFGQNATGLPDLVVLSLQEVAPLSYAFIGDYFLRPYIERFDTAINQAASQHASKHGTPDPAPATQRATRRKHYELMKSKNVGYTAILLFARDPSRIRSVKEAEVGFGAADMGNKGAVGLRAVYDAGEGGSTEMTFVATHLAAMEWNLPRRNANWASIMRCMTFGDPLPLLEMMRGGRSTPEDNDDAEGEGAGLLQGDRSQPDVDALQKQLHEMSLFKPTAHLFVGGDLNYRISTTSPPPGAAFPSLDADSDNFYPRFFELDQLTREKAAGRTLHGMTEAPVHFPPTYKYDVLEISGKDEDAMAPVPWKFAPHRYPSWTDRILYLDVPSWAASEQSNGRIVVHAYNALPLMRTSDHRPVFLRVEAPILGSADLTPPADLRASSMDPRVRLPTELDLEAWERRLAARRRELFVGWGMFLWSTKEGASVLATVLLASLGGYWLYRSS